MAADHEKEEDEGWTRALMQGFQAAGQKYRSIKLMPNLSSSLRTADVFHFRHPHDEQSRLLDIFIFLDF